MSVRKEKIHECLVTTLTTQFDDLNTRDNFNLFKKIIIIYLAFLKTYSRNWYFLPKKRKALFGIVLKKKKRLIIIFCFILIFFLRKIDNDYINISD